MGLCHQDSQKLQENVGAASCFHLSILFSNISENISAWPTVSFQAFYGNASFLLTTVSNLFHKCLPSYTFSSRFEILLPTHKISHLWHCKFQQIRTLAFCSWDDVFHQEGKSGSPKYLLKSTETTSTLASNTFVVGKLKSLRCNGFTS